MRLVAALFVGLDMADLTTVRTFALSARTFGSRCRPSGGRRGRGPWRSRGTVLLDAFLLVASESAIFVTLKPSEFLLKPASHQFPPSCSPNKCLPLLIAFVLFGVACRFEL